VQGFVNLNKPFGWTSHDCVAKMRKFLGLKQIGHAGTLDPAATGVLPLAVGKATRLLQFLPENKAYRATVKLGVRTTTDDLQGEVITQKTAKHLTLAAVKTALQQFQGKIEQIPPTYSAVQIGGKRLYQLARQGKTVKAPARTVEVFKIEILDWREGDFPEVDLVIACSAGTYIRAIARDLGTLLETGGTLAALQRTASSGFSLFNSLTFTELEAQLQAGNFQLLPPDTPLQHLQAVHVNTTDAKKWCQGQRITYQSNSSQLWRVYTEDGHFLGIAQSKNNFLFPLVVLTQSP
jgi:tRNA pseudouridine55 synthase